MQLDKKSLAIFQTYISIIANALLFGLKLWVGIITGSVAIVADAWHTISDSLSSLIVLVSIKMSAKPADEEHPFGHGRIELIGTIILGILLFVVAYEFLIESFQRIFQKTVIEFGVLAIGVTGLSILVKELMAQYSFWVARKTNYSSMAADGWHHRSDAISSVVVLAGIFLNDYIQFVDGYLGLIISVFIAKTAYHIVKKSINVLLGVSPDKKILGKLRSIAKKVSGKNLQLHHVHLHCYGEHQEVTFHIKLAGNLQLKKAHAIASNIENRIKKELDIEATIHVEDL